MRKIILVLILFNTLNSCNNLTSELKFMKNLKTAVSKKINTEEVEIKMNNASELVVIISDDKISNYNSKEKQTISNQITELVKDLLKNNEKILMGYVKFVSIDKLGVIQKSESELYKMKF